MISKECVEEIFRRNLLDVLREGRECVMVEGMCEEVSEKHRRFGELSEEEQVEWVLRGEV